MKNNPHVNVLKEIYRIYDTRIEAVDIACRKYCSACCTTNVTMTGLEGILILESAPENRVADVVQRVLQHDWPRYQPGLSTNAYVERCRTNTNDDTNGPPDDDYPTEIAGICPFLENDACSIYPARPFGCRCMISTQKCDQTDCAEIDNVTLTINTVFLQFIEHLDQNGVFGNMTDVLCRLFAPDRSVSDNCRVVSNRPIPALMVPPDHRKKVTGIVNDLHRLITRDA